MPSAAARSASRYRYERPLVTEIVTLSDYKLTIRCTTGMGNRRAHSAGLSFPARVPFQDALPSWRSLPDLVSHSVLTSSSTGAVFGEF
jgi:hypothetical protein